MVEDYNKLTVAQIRKIFGERKIPATGLTRKQQLVEKLLEEDAKTGSQSGEAGEAPVVELESTSHKHNDATEDRLANTEGTAESVFENTTHGNDDAQSVTGADGEPATQREEHTTQNESMAGLTDEPITSATTIAEETPLDPPPTPAVGTSVPTTVPALLAAEMPLDPPPTPAETSVERLQSAPLLEVSAQSMSQTPLPSVEISITQPSHTSSSNIESSLAGSSSQEETRKRKRRSPSPPLLSEDAKQKKMKQNDDGLLVHMKEDELPARVPEHHTISVQDNFASDLPVESSSTQEEIDGNESDETMADPAVDEKHDIHTHEVTSDISKTAISLQTSTPAIKPELIEASPKLHTGKDHRYKDLFSGSSGSGAQQSGDFLARSAYKDAEERVVTPAIHPATTALYVRNFARPIHQGNLKSHLAAVARPTQKQEDDGTDDSGSVIQAFHLDSINTHCFAKFASVSAAARVRTALHDRVWPEESWRNVPLWVDFIPEEKVQEWIDIELDAGGTRSSKRWEVQYKTGEDGVLSASLHEIGAAPTGPRRPTAAGPSLAPTLPRPEVRRESALNAKATAQPASFMALDQLFKFTTAKPKLYYLPVKPDLAEKRLHELEAKSSRRNVVPPGGSGFPDSRRYTFEEGSLLVDNGPEFGLRREMGEFGGRRGRGYYGAPRGAYRGRY